MVDETYRRVSSTTAVLRSGTQIAVGHFLPRLHLLQQPLWIGNLGRSVAAVSPFHKREPIPHTCIPRKIPNPACNARQLEELGVL